MLPSFVASMQKRVRLILPNKSYFQFSLPDQINLRIDFLRDWNTKELNIFNIIKTVILNGLQHLLVQSKKWKHQNNV